SQYAAARMNTQLKFKSAENYQKYKAKQTRARGRAGPGLETLTARYEAAKAARDAEFLRENSGRFPPQLEFVEKEELFDALVSFAQKMVFSADHQVLFHEHPGSARVAKGMVVSFFGGGSDPAAIQSSYVNVLQSIGNAIIVSV